MSNKIILASTSPRRREIMDSIGIEYDVVASSYEEDNTMFSDPYQLVETFAEEKAKDVLKKHPDAIVIGGDTIVVDPDGVLMGKATNRDEAFLMMKKLQGKKSAVVSGLAVLSQNTKQVGHEEVEVYFRPMTDEEINAYLDDPDADWHDKAGAYAIQGKAGVFIEKWEGEWSAIVGLPKQLLHAFLKDIQIDLA